MAPTNAVIRLGNALPSGVAARLGSSPTLKRMLRPLLTSAVPDEIVPVTIKSGAAEGLVFFIDPKREKFYWSGTYESKVQDTLINTLRPGDTFWDVGAHVGFFTLIAARAVGPAGKVHAFEPLDENRNRLETNVARNGFTNVVVHAEAISDRNGYADFVRDQSTSMGHLGDRSGNNTIRVPTSTLDCVLESAPTAPRLIKLDVEGSETSVLRGAASILGNLQTSWLIEVHDSAAPILGFGRFSKLPLDRNHFLAQPLGGMDPVDTTA